MSNIKIQDVDQRIQYTATSSQTVFAVPFPFLANSDLVVYQNGTLLALGASAGEYGVSGAGNPSGGTVTLVTGATLNDIITIYGNQPIDRTSIYSATISNLTGSDLNNDFNREIIMLKQLWTTQNLLQLQYQPYAEVSQDEAVTTDRRLPRLSALEAWRMNAGGTAIETFTVPSSGGIAPADATYITQTANADLTNEQAIGDLASGLLVGTTTTGVILSRILTGTSNEIGIADGDGISGNPTIGIANNPIMPGTGSMIPPKGSTAQRPGSPVDGMVRYNTDLSAFEVYESSSWDPLSGGVVDTVTGTANEIDVDNTDPANPVLSLSATVDLSGTLDIQSTTAVDGINNDSTLATASATTLSTDLALKTYIDNRTDLHYMEAVLSASTGNFVSTYDNGTAGVGATLTASSNGAFSLDGEAGVSGGRYLMKDQTTSYENGIYTLTQVGDGSNPAILTRATDFDQADEIDPGDIVPVLNGTVNGSTAWIQTATVSTIGTDAITFTQWTVDLSNVVTLDGTQTITGEKTFSNSTIFGDPGSEGTGININGTTYDSIAKVSDIGGSYAAQFIMHRHSTTLEPLLVGARSNSNTSSHGAVTGGQSLFTMFGAGWTGSHYDLFGSMSFTADAGGTISSTSSPGKFELKLTPDSSNTLATVLSIDNAGNHDIGSGSSTFKINSSTPDIDTILDEDTMSSDSATALATQQSIKAYVDAQVGGSGGLQSVQVFTSGGTWTKPAGINKVEVRTIGAGGGGGGTNGASAAGAGGGGGGTSIEIIDVTGTASETVTVGSGGTAGANTGGNGGAGGTSSFGAFCSATGGSGGLGGTSGSKAGTAAGVGSGGDINISGCVGTLGSSAAGGGDGGDSTMGGGGLGAQDGAGGAGGNYGAGGGGAWGVSHAGGVGAGGLVIVYEYS